MLQGCVGLNRELNYDFVHELKILKMHQATCGRTDVLADVDEKKLKQRKKELKVAKRKQKEEYKNLKEVEDAGIQELNGLASSVKEIEDQIQEALAQDRQFKDQRAKEGESGWQIPVDDPRYGNLKSSLRASREGCSKVIVSQDQVIDSLIERMEKERDRHGPLFEKRIEELRLKAMSLSSQIKMDRHSNEERVTPGGGKVNEQADEMNGIIESVLKAPAEAWKEFHGLELLDDGRIKLKVNESFVIMTEEDDNVVIVRSPEGNLVKQLDLTDEALKYGTTFVDLVKELRNPVSNTA